MAEFLESIQLKHKPLFAVIGAGNGGQAMAGFLALRGFQVALWNRSPDKVRSLRQIGGITLEGHLNGYAMPDLFTSDMAEAVKGAKVIMVTVPASGHRHVAKEMAPYLEDGQVVVLNPGRTGGALEFMKVLAEFWDRERNHSDSEKDVRSRRHGRKDIIIAEANTFLYASRTMEPGRSKVFGIKDHVRLAAFPANRTMEVLRLIRPAFPQFIPAENVLATSFDNMGAIFHPVPTLLNAARIESGQPFEHYKGGITPAVARVLERIDEERMRVAQAFGVAVRSAVEWLSETYGVSGANLHEAIHQNAAYDGIFAPDSLNTRYIYEDIPFSLVPMASFGHIAGVRTPLLRSMIRLADAVHGADYWSFGRKASQMGISRRKADEIREFVTEGVWPSVR